MKRFKKVLALLIVGVLMLSLCGCEFKLPWQKEDEGQPAGDDFGGDDFFGDFDTSVESTFTGMTYNVGDVILASEIVDTDFSKIVTTVVFIKDGEMAESIICEEAGNFSLDVVVQYDDGTQWSGVFEYAVEGIAVQIPQSVYEKMASPSYTKELVNVNDMFRFSVLSYAVDVEKRGEDNNTFTRFFGTDDGMGAYVRATSKADTISKYYDKTLARAITVAYYLNEVLGENWGSNDTIMKLVRILYGDDGVAAAQNLLNTVDGADAYMVLAMLADEPGLYGTNSLVFDLSNSIVSSTISDTGEFFYSTNGDTYPVRKVTRTFDGTQILGTTDSGTFDTLYIATINPENAIALSNNSGDSEIWSFTINGYNGSIVDLINNDALLSEVALGMSVPDYTDSTFDNMANMATWVRSLFVGENAIFSASYNGVYSDDSCGRHLDQIIIGDYHAIQVDTDAAGNPDDIVAGDPGSSDDGMVDDGVQVVYKKSYQQQHPGLFEWPESDIIYRRWIYTIGEDDPYQGTIYLADGTVLQGTSGLNTWTGEYTPTTDYTTKTHTMRTSSTQYNLTNEKDTSYVINTGRSNSSTTSITKGGRDYILSNVSEGWISNATNAPVYQSWQNAANFEAVAGSTYSNNGFLITPYTARIVTGAGTNEYPYFVELAYGGDYFVVYGASNDVDINEMLYIADNIIKAEVQDEQ